MKRRRPWVPVLLLAFAALYAASIWVSVMITPVPAVTLGVSRGAAVLQIRRPLTKEDAAPLRLSPNVPAPIELNRAAGAPVWWFRGFDRLRHYLRNDPEMVDSGWRQAGWQTIGSSSAPGAVSAPPGPILTPVAPGPGVAPWLPLSAEVPLWAVAALIGGPWLLVRVVRGRKRRSGGRCVFCGYDLRATAGGTCPECGEGVQPRGASNAA